MNKSEVKFQSVANEWLEFHRAKIKNCTYLMYKNYVEKLSIEFNDTDISQITPLQVQKLLNGLCSINYAKSTISKYRLTMQQIIKYGMKCGYLEKNSCEDTYVPKDAKTKKVDRVNDDAINKILKSYNCHFGLFALFLLTFGLRKSEALALTWEDIDMENNCITVNKIIEYNRSSPVVCNYLKNGDEERIIPILPLVRNILEIYREGKKGIVFEYKGKYLQRSRCEKEWGRYLNITGLEINKHQLRHTYATLLYKAGVDMKTAMMLLGHKDIAMLMKIYTHTDIEMLSLSIKHLSDYMFHRYDVI